MAIRSRESENRKTAEGPPPSPEDLCPPSTTASLIECLIDARTTRNLVDWRIEENQLRRPTAKEVDRSPVRPPIILELRGKLEAVFQGWGKVSNFRN